VQKGKNAGTSLKPLTKESNCSKFGSTVAELADADLVKVWQYLII